MPDRMIAHDRAVTTADPPRQRGPWRFVVLTLLAYVVLGAVAGAVWEWVWTPPDQVVRDNQVFYTSYESLRRVFTGTGLYVVVGGVTAALASLVACLLSRGRELIGLATVLIGSCAAAALMRLVGGVLGPDDPLNVARPGGTQVLPGRLIVNGFTPYLIWPMVSLFVLALVFFAWPSSYRPEVSDAVLEPGRHTAEGPGWRGPGAESTDLPTDRQRLVDQIRSARFTPVRIREGYEMPPVDALLDSAARAVRRGDPLGPILAVPLPTVKWREGYDMAEVRAFLDGLRDSADGTEPRR
jgi:hypothetical protein